MVDTFEAVGYKFHIPGFDNLTPTERATLKAYVTLTLDQEMGAGIAPNVTNVLKAVIASGETGITSLESRGQIHTAMRVLAARGHLVKRADIHRHPNYWPACLRVVPKPEFLVNE